MPWPPSTHTHLKHNSFGSPRFVLFSTMLTENPESFLKNTRSTAIVATGNSMLMRSDASKNVVTETIRRPGGR